MKKNFIIIIAAAIVACGLAFCGGTFYGKSKASPNFAFGNRQSGLNVANRQLNNRDRAGFVNGEIIAKDDMSITIKMRDGGSKIIFYSASAEISKFAKGEITDLTIGQNIMVNGAANADGSMTAQTIQLRPTSEIAR